MLEVTETHESVFCKTVAWYTLKDSFPHWAKTHPIEAARGLVVGTTRPPPPPPRVVPPPHPQRFSLLLSVVPVRVPHVLIHIFSVF